MIKRIIAQRLKKSPRRRWWSNGLPLLVFSLRSGTDEALSLYQEIEEIKTMKRTTLRNMKCGLIVTVVILMISVVPVTAQDKAPERSLEGVWLVKITPRNCTTGDPIPTAAFESLFTFHRDGTMLVSFRNNTFVLERTAAHGLWRRDLGWSDYSFKFVHLRRNLTTGLFAGKQEGGGTLVLSKSGDEFTTDGNSIVYSVDGIPGTPGCSNSVGTRFKLEP